MQLEPQTPVFSRGATHMPAADTVTTPMGYVREELQPGDPLPGLGARGLPEVLARCDELVLSFTGKLGDTLLAFGAVAAVLKYLELIRPEQLPIVRARGPHTTLFDHLCVLDRFDVRTNEPIPATARAVLVGDRPGTSTSAQAGAGRVLYTCDPEEPPCWSSGTTAYPALPARYFLTIERRVGIRLDDDGFMPLLHTDDAEGEPADRTTLNVGIVIATSWPMRKDYGLPRFLEALRQLAEQREQSIRALIVSGREDATAPELEAAPDDVTAELLRDAHYGLAAQALAACDLVIGNDTGLTHLAAATRGPDGAGPQVIGLHARHSHTKWRTGLPWHHAIATAFSEKMHREDRCPVRDRIDDRAFGEAANIASITPAQLAHFAGDVLTPLAKVGR
jgi:hypothetical protein